MFRKSGSFWYPKDFLFSPISNNSYKDFIGIVISGISFSFVGFGWNSGTAIEFVKFWDYSQLGLNFENFGIGNGIQFFEKTKFHTDADPC